MIQRRATHSPTYTLSTYIGKSIIRMTQRITRATWLQFFLSQREWFFSHRWELYTDIMLKYKQKLDLSPSLEAVSTLPPVITPLPLYLRATIPPPPQSPLIPIRAGVSPYNTSEHETLCLSDLCKLNNFHCCFHLLSVFVFPSVNSFLFLSFSLIQI